MELLQLHASGVLDRVQRALADNARRRALALFDGARLVLGPSGPLPAKAGDLGRPPFRWQAGAWTVYLKQSAVALGPIFWVLGAISYSRHSAAGQGECCWPGLCPTISSGRSCQPPVRFPSRPGSSRHSILLDMAKSVTWSVVAFQLLGLFNYFGGWVGPITVNLPYYQVEFFSNRPGAREDWKTEEILRLIEAQRDPSRPIANVTLVANDEYFNAPTFHWIQRRLGLEHARIRGVNSRLCELSEFVLLKDPQVGPAGVISGLLSAMMIRNLRAGSTSRTRTAAGLCPITIRRRCFASAAAKRSRARRCSINFQRGQSRLVDLELILGAWVLGARYRPWA